MKKTAIVSVADILNGKQDRQNLKTIIACFVDEPLHRGRVMTMFSDPAVFVQTDEDGQASILCGGKRVLLSRIRNLLYAKCPPRTDAPGPMHTRPRKMGSLSFSCLVDVLNDMIYWRGSRSSGASCALGEDGVITVPKSVLSASNSGDGFRFSSY